MDHFIERERVRALIIMSKACVADSIPCFPVTLPDPFLFTRSHPLSNQSHVPSFSADIDLLPNSYRKLQLAFIQNELAFDTLAQAREFLEKNGVSCWENPNGSDEDKVLDCKIAAAPLIQAFEENYRKVQIKGAV